MKPVVRSGKGWLIGVVLSALLLFAAIPATASSDTPVAYAGVYNRTAAVNYAHAYWSARNPNYVDYTSAGNNCTNYVSQVLEAGGLPQIPGNHNDSNITLWYHYSDWFGKHHSKTWSAADWMNQHAAQYQGSRFEFKGSPPSLDAGDFFVMDLQYTGKPTHARVMVGTGYAAQGVNYPVGTYGQLTDSNTTNRYKIIWNDPIASNVPIWAIHVLY